MNERIKSLVERAEYQAQKQSGSDWQVHIEPSREQIFEKFAELIIRECLTFVEPMPGSGDIDDLALEAAREGIKLHFGVEE
jgi:hypothetical protein